MGDPRSGGEEMLHAEDRAEIDEWGHMGIDDMDRTPIAEPDEQQEA